MDGMALGMGLWRISSVSSHNSFLEEVWDGDVMGNGSGCVDSMPFFPFPLDSVFSIRTTNCGRGREHNLDCVLTPKSTLRRYLVAEDKCMTTPWENVPQLPASFWLLQISTWVFFWASTFHSASLFLWSWNLQTFQNDTVTLSLICYFHEETFDSLISDLE